MSTRPDLQLGKDVRGNRKNRVNQDKINALVGGAGGRGG